MLWWSWQLWRILTMGDTRHVRKTKYIRCDVRCGGHPPHHQLGGKYGLKIHVWWTWIKLPLTGHRQSTNYFDHFGLWDVCPALVWHWRCRHSKLGPGGLSSCVSTSTFCLIFNSSDVGPKTPPPSKEAFSTLSYQNKICRWNQQFSFPLKTKNWPGNYNNSKWIASGWPYKWSSQGTKTVRIIKGWRQIIVSLVLFLNQFNKPDLFHLIWFVILDLTIKLWAAVKNKMKNLHSSCFYLFESSILHANNYSSDKNFHINAQCWKKLWFVLGLGNFPFSSNFLILSLQAITESHPLEDCR